MGWLTSDYKYSLLTSDYKYSLNYAFHMVMFLGVVKDAPLLPAEERICLPLLCWMMICQWSWISENLFKLINQKWCFIENFWVVQNIFYFYKILSFWANNKSLKAKHTFLFQNTKKIWIAPWNLHPTFLWCASLPSHLRGHPDCRLSTSNTVFKTI